MVAILGGAVAAAPDPLARVAVSTPAARQAPFGAVAAKLAQQRSRLRNRVRIPAGTALRVARNGAAFKGDFEVELAVAAELGDQLRVVIDEDGALFELWLARAAAAPTVLATVELAAADGTVAANGAGVWLTEGTPITVGAEAGGWREVAANAGGVEVSGWVRRALVGPVWVPGVELEQAEDAGELLHERTAVRAAPGDDAPIVAMVDPMVALLSTAAADGWRRIDLRAGAIEVRGYVPSASLYRGGVGHVQGAGICGGTGDTEHPESLQVPEGTCLYDRASGTVIGATVEDRTREGLASPGKPGWHEILIETKLGHIPVAVHVVSGAVDAGTATFAHCP